MTLSVFGRRGTPRPLGAVALLVVVVLLATGCSANLRTGDVEIRGIARFKLPAFPQTGANKVQMFTEMHYQPSYRSQEGPRLLPPPDSVPVTGRELRLATLEEYRGVAIPDRVVGAYDPTAAQRLYMINCVVCHGETLDGNGPIRKFITRGPFPADLTLPLTRDSADGELFAFISNGGRQGLAAIERGKKSASPMPPFQFLLTEEERWMLVKYLRSR